MKISYEEILRKVDGFGTYQKRVMLMVAIPQILNGITTFIPNFILAEHKHRCRIPGVDNDTYATHDDSSYNVTKCSYTYNSTINTCSSWVYDQSLYTETMISTFDMVCDKGVYRSHLIMAHHIGSCFGGILASLCADILGRKPSFCIGGLLLFASNIVLPWSHNFYLVAFLRFVNGLSGSMQYMVGFVLATEMVIPSKRMTVAFCISGFYTIGLYIMDLTAYFVRDWHHLVLYTSIPLCICVMYWFILPESPRWLVARGKSARAVAILNTMSRVNKSKVTLDINNMDVLIEKNNPSFCSSLKTVFKSKMLVLRMAIASFNWAAVNLSYYGISMNVGKLGGNVFINYLIATSVGIIGEFIGMMLSNKIGRKKMHMSLMIIGGISCLLTIFTSLHGKGQLHALDIALAMIGKMTSSGAFLVIYLYTVELSPTSVRVFFLGICSNVGRVGSMSSSYIGDLGVLLDTQFGRALPLIIFGCVTTAAGLLCYFLPETKDNVLPETIDEAENMGKVQGRTLTVEEVDERLMEGFKLEDKIATET